LRTIVSLFIFGETGRGVAKGFGIRSPAESSQHLGIADFCFTPSGAASGIDGSSTDMIGEDSLFFSPAKKNEIHVPLF
jgi:hypothetical protein